MSRTYRLVMALMVPVVRWWARLEVVGATSSDASRQSPPAAGLSHAENRP